MKNLLSSDSYKDRMKETEPETEYCLCCDFGYDVTSPIPSAEPLHKNARCVVPAVAGTVVKLFPGDPERFEFAEFDSYLLDEAGRIKGIKCRIRPDERIMKFLGDPEDLVWEVDLICGKKCLPKTTAMRTGKTPIHTADCFFR